MRRLDSINSSATATAIRQKLSTMRLSFLTELTSFGLNLIGALLANSLTLWANTLRVGLDAAATFFAFSVTRRIARGNDRGFDYGLGKWENLSALVNAIVMLVALLFIGFRSFNRFLHPTAVNRVGFGLAVLLACSGINLYLGWKFWRLRRSDPSPVVEAQFVLYRNAAAATVISSTMVLISWLARDHTWASWCDPVGSLFLCGVILYGMVTLFHQSIPDLLDRTVEESLQLTILRGLANCYEDYDQVHGIRARRSGKTVFIELFLEFEPVMTVREMTARAARFKSMVEELIPHSEVWVIPANPPRPADQS